MSRFREDIEKEAAWFGGERCPDGAMGCLPFRDEVRLDVECYEEGELLRLVGLSRSHTEYM